MLSHSASWKETTVYRERSMTHALMRLEVNLECNSAFITRSTYLRRLVSSGQSRKVTATRCRRAVPFLGLFCAVFRIVQTGKLRLIVV